MLLCRQDRQRQRDRQDRKIRFMLLCRQKQKDREDRKIRFILLSRQRQTETEKTERSDLYY